MDDCSRSGPGAAASPHRTEGPTIGPARRSAGGDHASAAA